MIIAFVDDSRQDSPTRHGMLDRPMLSAGALLVPAEAVADLESSLAELCSSAGFPDDPTKGEFKWSPSKGLWMRKGLVDEARYEFFAGALRVAAEQRCEAFVAITDTCAGRIQPGITAERECTTLCMERVDNACRTKATTGLVVHDMPSGDRASESAFLLECLQTRASGTGYVQMNSIAISVLTADSRFVRCLQLADVIVGCLTAFVSGELTHSPPVAEHIKPILRREAGRVGGTGIKIHPDLRYGNLYHWLFDDDTLRKGQAREQLPRQGRYADGPDRC